LKHQTRGGVARDVTLRAATAADSDFAYRVVERTMREYVTRTWGSWAEADTRANTAADALAGRSQIIEVGASPAGLLRFDRQPTHLQLDQLYILPEHQRQGIGAQVLGIILAQAAHAPVRLRVLRVNPAKAFYERHGFKVVSESPERFFMEHAPDLQGRASHTEGEN
jgi:ribosomal protein S18 acetylase RimI-like enzyme